MVKQVGDAIALDRQGSGGANRPSLQFKTAFEAMVTAPRIEPLFKFKTPTT